MQYTIIRDTREKEGEGWTWRVSQNCAGTITKALKTGDYTLSGYEDVLAIERKGSIAEWAVNIHQQRFVRELARLQEIRFPFLLLEFAVDDVLQYPVGSTIPKRLWSKLRFKGPYLLKKTIEYQMQYSNIKFIYCGNHGKDMASSIFKRTIEVIEDDEKRAYIAGK